MPRISCLPLVLLATIATGCTNSSGRTYQNAEWRAGRRSLGQVLVFVPNYGAAGEQQQPRQQPSEKDRKIRSAIHDALAQLPGAKVMNDVADAADVTAQA